MQGNPPLNLPLFPHAPEIPAETCRSLAESDDDPTTPGESLGEACEGWRRLLLEDVCGSLRGAAETTSGEGLGEAREGSRRLLLEDVCGKLAEKAQNDREVAQTGCGVAAKWREVAAKGQYRAIPGQYLGNTWAIPGQLVTVSGS